MKTTAFNITQMRPFLTILLVLLSYTLNAQNKAKILLDEVSTKVETYDNIALSFKYALVNVEENINQETLGDVILQGNKYVLNILGITRIFDGETLFSISAEDEEVTISSENAQDDNTITPSKMLFFYEDGYNYEMDIIQNIKERKIQYIKLNPIDSNSEINYILLGIDLKTKHIYNLIEVGINNTKTILTVNSFKTNEPLSKTLFTFDKEKYKDFYINKID